MIYDDSIEEVQTEEETIAIEEKPSVRLAQVTSLTDGKAAVKFYGESEASTKFYPYIEGYKPTVNDNVAMLAQGNTFIIIGKISSENITTNYDVQKGELTTILTAYLTTTDATSTYLSKTDAISTYLSKSDATSTYLSKNDAANTYVSKADGVSKIKYGSSYSLELNNYGRLMPNSSDSISIGYTSGYLSDIFASAGHFRYIRERSETSGGLEFNNRVLKPVNTGSTYGISLGSSSYQFENIYGKNVYVNGSPISESDKRKKKSIKNLATKYIRMLLKLCPVTYKYKDGQSGRTHMGFIAQEVEQAAKNEGIELEDLAAVCIDEDGTYGIRYEEFIPALTAIVQDQQKEIDDLRTRLDSLERALKK